MNLNVKCGLWVTMMCQYRFIVMTYVHSDAEVDNGRGEAGRT